MDLCLHVGWPVHDNVSLYNYQEAFNFYYVIAKNINKYM